MSTASTPTSLIPQTFWFRAAIPCPRIDDLPKGGRSKQLFELPESCRLPDLGALDGRSSWADVRVAWNTRGLAVQVSVIGKVGPIVRDPSLPEASDGASIWIDTRDARDIHRATRFCHRYTATIGSSAAGKLDVDVQLRKIHRAAADPTGIRPSAVRSQALAMRGGWRLWLFFPAEALHGFDPETSPRLGFYYAVTDPNRGAQWLAVGSDFPVAEDPSLWTTLELV